VQVDADLAEQLGVELLVLLEQPPYRVGGGLVGEPVPDEHAAGDGVGRGEHGEQEVLGADVVVVEPAGLGLGAGRHLPGRLGEPLEHRQSSAFPRKMPRLVAYFLCTACRVTPSRFAISCQVQPCSRALRTWSSSSRSASSRSARTARSPTAGSRLLASAATFVVSVMVST